MLNKRCPRCGEVKIVSEFDKNKARHDGLASICKICKTEDRKNYIKKNPTKYKQKRREQYLKHKDSEADSNKKYRRNNAIKFKVYSVNYKNRHPDRVKASQEKYRKNNLSKFAAKSAKRRAVQKNSTFEVDSKINRVYAVARMLTKLTGKEYQVDHIVPLKGVNVCGLHAYNNLCVIPAKDNLKKGNKFDDFVDLKATHQWKHVVETIEKAVQEGVLK